jgi:hypothetical protein
VGSGVLNCFLPQNIKKSMEVKAYKREEANRAKEDYKWRMKNGNKRSTFMLDSVRVVYVFILTLSFFTRILLTC